jgi:hypothetical protein
MNTKTKAKYAMMVAFIIVVLGYSFAGYLIAVK